jgi:predicted DNA-binding transcriptional regulator AlpA
MSSLLLNEPDAIKELRISRTTFLERVRPELEIIRIGRSVRFLRSDLVAWIERQRPKHDGTTATPGAYKMAALVQAMRALMWEHGGRMGATQAKEALASQGHDLKNNARLTAAKKRAGITSEKNGRWGGWIWVLAEAEQAKGTRTNG